MNMNLTDNNGLKILIISIILLFLLFMGMVLLQPLSSANETMTVKVDAKTIKGADGYDNPLFIIRENATDSEYLLRYPTDYYQIKVGETVKLKVSESGYCEIVQEKGDDGKWV